MNPTKSSLLCLAGWVNREQQAVIEYLGEEVRVVRGIHGKRPRFNDAQRCRLAAKAKKIRFGKLREIANIATPQTLLRWYRSLVGKKYDSSKTRRVGRPSTKKEIAELGRMLQTMEKIQTDFNNSESGGKKVSLADVLVLGGCAAVEQAAKSAGHTIQVPFSPGRTDALQEQTDVESFAVLEPTADGFPNYLRNGHSRSAVELLVDRAHMLTLTAPEMTVLVGGIRVLNANAGQSELGAFTKRPEMLTNDFFVNLLDMNTKWQVSSKCEHVFEGRDHGTGESKWMGTAVDLVFGSNSQLRAIGEVYACDDSQQAFVRDFVAAWDKVMNLDRFDRSV